MADPIVPKSFGPPLGMYSHGMVAGNLVIVAGQVGLKADGRIISQADWDARKHDWLPTPEDEAYVASLMKPVVEPGKFAGWIAPPARGINGQPVEFEYVKLSARAGEEGHRG